MDRGKVSGEEGEKRANGERGGGSTEGRGEALTRCEQSILAGLEGLKEAEKG